MIPREPLLQLRDLNKASPQFHEQLSNFFRGDVYQNVLPHLSGDNLAWLVEYLGGVSLQIIFFRAVPNTSSGSCRHSWPCKRAIPRITIRTGKDLWHEGSAAKIVHPFRVPSWVRV